MLQQHIETSLSNLAERLVRFCLRVLKRLVPIHFMEICYSENETDFPQIEGYENRVVGEAEFCEAVSRWKSFEDDYHFAFARGDYCVATFCGDELVGYNFYSSSETMTDDMTEFHFPDSYRYSYAAYTLASHRGRALSPSRWTYFRNWAQSRNLIKPIIYYTELTNVAALRSGASADRTRLGYAGYVRLAGRTRYWRSPGCKAHGVGFRAPDSQM